MVCIHEHKFLRLAQSAKSSIKACKVHPTTLFSLPQTFVNLFFISSSVLLDTSDKRLELPNKQKRRKKFTSRKVTNSGLESHKIKLQQQEKKLSHHVMEILIFVAYFRRDYVEEKGSGYSN